MCPLYWYFLASFAAPPILFLIFLFLWNVLYDLAIKSFSVGKHLLNCTIRYMSVAHYGLRLQCVMFAPLGPHRCVVNGELWAEHQRISVFHLHCQNRMVHSLHSHRIKLSYWHYNACNTLLLCLRFVFWGALLTMKSNTSSCVLYALSHSSSGLMANMLCLVKWKRAWRLSG